MNHEQIESLRGYLDGFEHDNEVPLPDSPTQRLRRLERSHHWEHCMQEILLESMEDNWHMQQVARAEAHGS